MIGLLLVNEGDLWVKPANQIEVPLLLPLNPEQHTLVPLHEPFFHYCFGTSLGEANMSFPSPGYRDRLPYM